MRVLVTAPYVGEIGWELMAWQGWVRRVFARGGFDRLVVLGAARRSALYADMPLDYRTVDLSGVPGAAFLDGATTSMALPASTTHTCSPRARNAARSPCCSRRAK